MEHAITAQRNKDGTITTDKAAVANCGLDLSFSGQPIVLVSEDGSTTWMADGDLITEPTLADVVASLGTTDLYCIWDAVAQTGE